MKRARATAFTIIEVVMALAVGLLLWGATASTLATMARMEASADRFHEASLLVRTLAAREWNGGMEDESPAGSAWRVDALVVDGENRQPWSGWRLRFSPAARPDLRVFLGPQEWADTEVVFGEKPEQESHW